MKYKTIETMREIRQWVQRVILPTGAAVLYIDFKYPDLKYRLKDRFTKKKDEEQH